MDILNPTSSLVYLVSLQIDKRLDAVFSKKPHIKKVVPAVSEAQIKGEQKGRTDSKNYNKYCFAV